jgi:predicted PurR-regulated permease PerM
MLLIPFYLFFLLTSLNRFWGFAQSTMIPYDYRDLILRILRKTHHSLSAFFRGRLLVCLFIGIIAWMGLLFLGVPFSFLLGFSIGFATIVPLLGIAFLIPAMAMYGLAGAGLEQQCLLLLLYAAIQGLEMFIFTPFILGKEVELHPMVLVMSILICGYLFGGIGVVLAVPIVSTAKILFEEFVFPSFIELSKKDSHSPKVIKRKGSL